MIKLMFLLIFACFLIPGREIPDSTKVKKQMQMNNIKLDTMNIKLDSIIKILEKRKNDTLKLEL